jgi:FG-GAP-like repeat
LSADGNTALVGGSSDDSFAGAAWVYTRSGGVWTQQGSKLVGTGAVGAARQGFSVALSGDGNTALVGGPVDDSQAGAAWVFTRSGGVWTQQGGKLVGTGAVGSVVQQGHSVGLSADGNTAIVGGPFDDSFAGAAWVYTRSGGVWTQQGAKLVGTGAAGAGEQGFSVGLSADGNFAILGGLNDNGLVGATWVFSRSGGVWTQYGAKLVGTGVVGSALQGSAAAISGDHRAILVGGVGDNGSGAAWVFAIPVSHDFNGDGMSDIAWRDTSGNAAMWEMNGTDITPGPVFGPIPTNWSIVGQRDFNGDGRSDWLWRDTIGHVAMWLLNGFQVLQVGSVGTVSTNWSIVGTADFDGDGKGDILWRDAMTGQAAIWLMNGTAMQSGAGIGTVTTDWIIAGTGDFNGDGKSDILWRNTTSGQVAIWFMDGTTVAGGASIGSMATAWTIVETGDFNGDGKSDLLWRDSSGNTAIWLMDGTTVLPSSATLGNVPWSGPSKAPTSTDEALAGATSPTRIETLVRRRAIIKMLFCCAA